MTDREFVIGKYPDAKVRRCGLDGYQIFAVNPNISTRPTAQSSCRLTASEAWADAALRLNKSANAKN